MLSNDIKKGMKLVANGFEGTMEDNKKGNIRLVQVDGICGKEYGSVYVWDIQCVYDDKGNPHRIELTEKQKKARSKWS